MFNGKNNETPTIKTLTNGLKFRMIIKILKFRTFSKEFKRVKYN